MEHAETAETVQILGHLKALEAKNAGRDFYAELNSRKKSELDFHNACRDKSGNANLPQDTYELLHGNKKYYATVELSRRYVIEWLEKNVPGKVFLDYACGNGQQAIRAAQFGSRLSIGLDISDVSVRNARVAANDAGVGERCFFLQGDCENTGLPNESVDVILCSGMLHHLDLSYAFPELRRILKKGGVILAVEALDYNPAIKLYRNMTPSMRTDWEKNHILSFKDIRFAKRFFDLGKIHFWHLFSILGAGFRSRPLQSFLDKLDLLLLKIPCIRLLAWQFTFELHKKKEI